MSNCSVKNSEESVRKEGYRAWEYQILFWRALIDQYEVHILCDEQTLHCVRKIWRNELSSGKTEMVFKDRTERVDLLL